MRKKCFTLFYTMLYISAFTFGGGFVIVSLMKKQFVDKLHWFTDGEMLNMTAIAQSSPGAIAVNAAIIVGYTAAGAAGMFSAVLGTVLPPFILLTIISYAYETFRSQPVISLLLEGLQCGVVAVVLDVTVDLGLRIARSRDVVHLLILAASFVLAQVLRINVIFIVLGAVLVGILRALAGLRKGGAAK